MLINFKLAHITKFFDVQLFVVCRRLRVAIGSLYARLRFMPEFLKRTISRHSLSLSFSLSLSLSVNKCNLRVVAATVVGLGVVVVVGGGVVVITRGGGVLLS